MSASQRGVSWLVLPGGHCAPLSPVDDLLDDTRALIADVRFLVEQSRQLVVESRELIATSRCSGRSDLR